MKIAPAELVSSDEVAFRRKGWSLSRWLLLIAIVLAIHVLLIFLFGSRKRIKPRLATNVPQLELVANSGDWLALDNPTLFALPNRQGFAGPAWLERPPLHVQMPDWSESPRWLRIPYGALGTTFNRFMQTNQFATFHFELKPPIQLTRPMVPLQPPISPVSTLRVEGNLAMRPLLDPMKLPSWPASDLIAPSRVQVLVNAAGEVISAALLSPENSAEIRDSDADEDALNLARAARFAPASGLTVGKLIFHWHTAAPPATNAPSGL